MFPRGQRPRKTSYEPRAKNFQWWSMMLLTICFVILQNQNKKKLNKNHLNKNALTTSMSDAQCCPRGYWPCVDWWSWDRHASDYAPAGARASCWGRQSGPRARLRRLRQCSRQTATTWRRPRDTGAWRHQWRRSPTVMGKNLTKIFLTKMFNYILFRPLV